MANSIIYLIKDKISQAEILLSRIKNKSKKQKLSENIANYEEIISHPSFWENSKTAPEILKQYKELENDYNKILSFEATLKNTQDLIIDLEDDENQEDVLLLIQNELNKLLEDLEIEECKFLFNDINDKKGAYLEIHAGSGGIDAQDFAQMLLRMYTRWCTKQSYLYTVISATYSDVGVKSVILEIKGLYAYGWLKGEEGVHRLVRMSPFNAEGKRHTSFVAVAVYPVIENNNDIEINPAELKVETFRASGAGGQHVNTTDSAVRITHLKTGLVVQCQNERSQHQNKNSALSLLKSKLLALKKTQEDKEKQANYLDKQGIDYGSQIRSYIMHPYSLVKDHRTKVEKPDCKNVLDGDINSFLIAYLTL